MWFFFFFTDTATTEIYTLSLHDALPISKFSRAGHGRVALAAAADDRWVEVSVADDGPGIAPERQGIIFAQFLEREDTLQDEPRGSGLGLAVSKQVIEHMGGRIWVESSPGDGARFAFTVPRAGDR